MTFGMVVLAGGIGRRIGRPFPKQFLLLGGKPLIIHVLEKARALTELERIVITCPEAHLDETRPAPARTTAWTTASRCIVGGATRQESVFKGLMDARGRRLGDPPRGRPAARHARGVPGPDREPGRERDVRQPAVVHGRPRPRVRRGPARSRGAGQRPAADEVRSGEARSPPTRPRATPARRSPTTRACSSPTPADRVRILPGNDRNVKITVPADIVMAEALYADFIGRGS